MLIRKWFFIFLVRSVSQRKGRFVISSCAVMMSVAVVTALVTLSLGTDEKIGNELKQYGANMIVTEKHGGMIERSLADDIRSTKHVRSSALQTYGTGHINGKSYEMIAIEPDSVSGVRIRGSLPRNDNELMVGTDIKDLIGAAPGDTVRFDNGKVFQVTGIFEKGSEEDSALVIPSGAARDLLGTDGISAVLLNVDSDMMDEVRDEMTRTYPSVSVKTIRQVAMAQENLLTKMQLLMLIVTIVVIFASVIALGSTMSANVIERTGEIGLMKAIGATAADIRKFFVTEAALTGMTGAVSGYIAGIVAAEGVSWAAFGSYVSVDPYSMVIALFIGTCMSMLSTWFPVMRAMKLKPAIILRGE